MTTAMDIADEVSEARAEGRGVVALESTLVTHGLPWPDNLETARNSEEAVRQSGAVPATIAIIRGRIRVGLSAEDLEQIARGRDFLKAGRRDLGITVARGLDAGTTISATLWIARSCGLGVMATGGIGGVHRDAATTFDVSTDLDELARSDGSLVVCSGFKSILDLPATLDALETRGVPVVGYRTRDLAAFTEVTSGLSLEARVESPEEAAALVQAHRALKLPGAIVLAQPVAESDAVHREVMQAALDIALGEARAQRVSGKAVTPFLLAHIRRTTGGQSLRANRSIIVANARLAGLVAASLPSRPRA